MKIPREKEGEKTNIVCVCIYIWLPLGGEVAKEKTFFFRVHSLSLMAGCQRLRKNVQRVMKIPWEKEGGKTNIVYE